MKRTVFLALLCLTLTLLLTGCASNADTQPSPSVGMTTPMTRPNVTNMPSATNNMDGVLGSDAARVLGGDVGWQFGPRKRRRSCATRWKS